MDIKPSEPLLESAIMTEDLPLDAEWPDTDEEQKEYQEQGGKEDKADNVLQQADRLLAAAQTVEDIEQVRELFRWIHQGI